MILGDLLALCVFYSVNVCDIPGFPLHRSLCERISTQVPRIGKAL